MTMMKKEILFFLIVLTVGLDSTLLPSFAFFEIQINLTLCVVVALGVCLGTMTGTITGLLAGYIMDLLFGPARGFYMLIYMLVGYGASSVFSRGMQDSFFFYSLFVACVYVVKELITMMLTLLLGVNVGSLPTLLFRYILPSAVLTGVTGFLVYVLIRAFAQTNVMRNRKKKTGLG